MATPKKQPVKTASKNASVAAKPLSAPGSAKRTLRLQYLFLGLLGLILYVSTWNFDYALDDMLMIKGNVFTQQGLAGTYDIFTTDAFTGFFGEQAANNVAGGRYRPFTHFMFAATKEVFGFNPTVGHIQNILLYIGLLLVVFAFMRRLFPEDDKNKTTFFSVPLVITALFAAHPLHSEAVANIKGVDEIVVMLCSVGAMILMFDYVKKQTLWRLPVAGFLFLIALFSKESAITWLAVLVAMLYFFTNAKTKDYLITTGTLLIPTIIFLAVRYQVVGGLLNTSIPKEILNNPFVNSTKGEEIATVIFTWLIYVKLLIFPHPLTHDYYPKQIAITNFGDPLVLLMLALVVLSVIVIIRGLKSKSIVSFALIFFWATFSIVSNLLFNIGTFMNERFMFVPLLGVAMIAGYYFGKYRPKAKWLSTVLLIVLGLYSVKTISRSFAWKDNESLFLTDIKTSTNSIKGNLEAAELLIDKAGKETNQIKRTKVLQQAVVYLNQAEKIEPKHQGAYDLGGKAHFMLGDLATSLQKYKTFLSLVPYKQHTRNNIYLVGVEANRLLTQVNDAIKTGHVTSNVGLEVYSSVAIDAFTFLMKEEPDSAKHPHNLALTYEILDQTDKSIACIEAALKINPNYIPALNKGAEIYSSKLKNHAKAESMLLKSYELDPANSSTLTNLGALYGALGQAAKSEEFFLKAVQNSPDDVALLNNLGTLYRSKRDLVSAEKYLTKALSVDANHIPSLEALGLVYFDMKKYDRAATQMRRIYSLMPGNKNNLNNLSILYGLMGRKDSAAYFKQLMR